MEQLAHSSVQSLQKSHWLWMRGKLASHWGMEQEQLQGRSVGRHEVASLLLMADWHHHN